MREQCQKFSEHTENGILRPLFHPWPHAIATTRRACAECTAECNTAATKHCEDTLTDTKNLGRNIWRMGKNENKKEVSRPLKYLEFRPPKKEFQKRQKSALKACWKRSYLKYQKVRHPHHFPLLILFLFLFLLNFLFPFYWLRFFTHQSKLHLDSFGGKII